MRPMNPGEVKLTDTDAQGAVVLMRGEGDAQSKVDAATSAGSGGPKPAARYASSTCSRSSTAKRS